LNVELILSYYYFLILFIKIKLKPKKDYSKTGRKIGKTSPNNFGNLKFQSKNGSIEDYEMGDLLGKGAYGEVYHALHKETGKNYAIKVYDRYQMSQDHKLK